MPDFKLYEINALLQAALDEQMALAEQNDGIVPPETDMKVEALGLAREQKLESCLGYYKNEDGLADMLEREAKALLDRARSHRSHSDWMKQYITKNVKAGEKLEFAIGRISWRRSDQVVIPDIAVVPDNWCKIERVPMKKEIKESIKAGAVYDWATIEEKQNIQIK